MVSLEPVTICLLHRASALPLGVDSDTRDGVLVTLVGAHELGVALRFELHPSI